MTCLFVGNLTKSLTEQNLIVAFSEIGPCKVELKGPYAFIEYENASDSKEAMRKLNKTTLNGANGYSKVRIEFSKKKKVNDKLEDNDNNEYSSYPVLLTKSWVILIISSAERSLIGKVT